MLTKVVLFQKSPVTKLCEQPLLECLGQELVQISHAQYSETEVS